MNCKNFFRCQIKMSIENVSTLYKRIHSGSEGGGEFSRIMSLLLIAEAKQKGWQVISFNDSAGDYKGLDLLIIKDGKTQEGFQFKFYPSPLNASHKSSIKASIEKVLTKDNELNSLTIVTPEDVFHNEVNWFNELNNIYGKGFGGRKGFWSSQPFIEHLGHKTIIELALRFPHIGKKCFPELFNYNTESFKLVLSRFNDKQVILDVAFQNTSESPIILSKIQIIKTNEWSGINGIPAKYLLKPIGQIKLKVDMAKGKNGFILRNPIIIHPGNPTRFNIQLINFRESMQSSGIEFKFRFYFNDDEFFLDSREYSVNE